MSANDFYDSPNEDSPTIGIELAIDSAREDIISHVSDAAAIILLANGHFIAGSLVALYCVAQFIYAFKKELRLRAWRARTSCNEAQIKP